MADQNSMAGGAQTPAPAWDITSLKDFDAIKAAVHDLLYNGSAEADLSHNAMGERWYALADKIKAAVDNLGQASSDFQSNYSQLNGGFTGEAADAFFDYAGKLYKQSEDVYSAGSDKAIATTIGNIGHDIQGFAVQFGDICNKGNNTWESIDANYIQAVKATSTPAQVSQITNEAQAAHDKLLAATDDDLRNLLRGLKSRFESRAGHLPALTVGAPSTGDDQSANAGTPTGNGSTGDGSTGDGSTGDGTTTSGGDVPAQQKLLAGADGTGTTDGTTDGLTTLARTPTSDTSGTTPQTTSAPLDTTPVTDAATTPMTPATDPGTTPATTSTDPNATSGATTPAPATDPGLQDAQQAATDGLNALGSATPSSSGGSTGGDTGSGGDTSGGSGSPAGLDSAGGTTGSGSDGGSGTGSTGGDGSSSGDDSTNKALDDARKAANDAIDGLGNPDSSDSSGDTPDTESSGPGGDSSTGDGSTGDGSSDDANRQQALDDARKAANDAIDGLQNGDPSTSSNDPNSLSGFLNGQDGGASNPLHDAKDAMDKSIEALPGYDGNDAYAKGLHDAQAAADNAIQSLPDYGSAPAALAGTADAPQLPDLSGGPGADGGLGGGGGGLGDVGGGLGGGGGVPGPPSLDGGPGGPPANGILDTDQAASQAGLAPAYGSGAVQGMPATAGGPMGPTAGGGAPASSTDGGMPMGMGGGMGGMGGGGMGGGGMGGQQKEREPAAWMQAEDGTWQDPSEGEEPQSVLGRR